jgi:hypothetical protein
MAKKGGVEKPEKSKAGFYVKASNALFYNLSNSLIEQGKFKDLRSELRTAGMSIFSASYISVMFFSSLLVLIGAFIIIMLLSITSLGFFGYNKKSWTRNIAWRFYIFSVILLPFD